VTTEGTEQLKNSLSRQLAKRGYANVSLDELIDTSVQHKRS